MPDGRDAAAYVIDWYGPPFIFVAFGRGSVWTSPAMTGFQLDRYNSPSMQMSELSGGRLRFAFSAATPGQPGTPPVMPSPDAIELSISEVLRDTDRDGWTDITERFLDMNWREADSDHDGIPDGRDDAPLLSGLTVKIEEDDQILQRAVFAMFGLTDAPAALFVKSGVRRFHPFGLPGPVFYAERETGVRVTWKITAKAEDTATVEITDYEGPLAASGNAVTMRKIRGAWYAVAIKMLWIS